MDRLSCTPANLVATTAENAGIRKTAPARLYHQWQTLIKYLPGLPT
jgi:hypothetical protein